MKLSNYSSLAIIASLFSLSNTFATDSASDAPKREVMAVARHYGQPYYSPNKKLITSIADVREINESPNIPGLPEDFFRLIREFAGTKATHGVCHSWRDLNLGSPGVPGLGSFWIAMPYHHYARDQYGHGPNIFEIDNISYNITDEYFVVLQNVKKLRLTNFLVNGMSVLRHIPNLTLENPFCGEYPHYNNPIPLPVLHNANLTLQHCYFDQVSIPSTIPNVTVTLCPYLTSVSVPRTAQNLTLTLNYLPKLRNVSALGHVQNLTLKGLPRDIDVSALGGDGQNLTIIP